MPAFTEIYLDRVLGEARSDWLRPLVVSIAVTVLFKLTLESFKFLFLRRLKIHLAVTMSSTFFWHLLKLPMQFYAQRFGGEIATRQNTNTQLAEVLSGKLADACLEFLGGRCRQDTYERRRGCLKDPAPADANSPQYQD